MPLLHLRSTDEWVFSLQPRFAERYSRVSNPKCTDVAAIEATEDLDIVDLLYERGVTSSASSEAGPLLRVECPGPQSSQVGISFLPPSNKPQSQSIP